MKTIIIGKKVESAFVNNRYLVSFNKFARYFPSDNIWHRSDPLVFSPNSVYFKNASYRLECPTPIVKYRYVLEIDDQSWGRPINLRYVTGKKSKCVGLKTRGCRYYRAFFFIKEKSIVCSSLLVNEEIECILDYLEGCGFIHKLPIEDEPALETTQCVEIHDGLAEIVTIPLPPKVTIGCDPEFEYMLNGHPAVPPIKYMGTTKQIGMDGSGLSIELRPHYGNTVEEVIDNLKYLMKEVKDPISVVGNTYPLGGHIHLGIGYQVDPPKDLMNLLDYFLGKRVISLSGLARGGYLKYGAYEMKEWGFEYRTPPSAIFLNPVFAKLSLKICQNVTAAFMGQRTIKVTADSPIEEDYINYAGLSHEEYAEFCKQIDEYSSFLLSPDRYSVNIASFWDENANKTTTLPGGEETTIFRTASGDILDSIGNLDSIGAPLPTETPTEAHRVASRYLTRLIFSDEWAANIVNRIKSEVLHRLETRILETTILNTPTFLLTPNDVVLYGLNRNRGSVVAGYDSVHFPRVTPPIPERHSYGLPRIFRMAGVEVSSFTEDEMDSIVSELADAIVTNSFIFGGIVA